MELTDRVHDLCDQPLVPRPFDAMVYRRCRKAKRHLVPPGIEPGSREASSSSTSRVITPILWNQRSSCGIYSFSIYPEYLATLLSAIPNSSLRPCWPRQSRLICNCTIGRGKVVNSVLGMHRGFTYHILHLAFCSPNLDLEVELCGQHGRLDYPSSVSFPLDLETEPLYLVRTK